MRYFAKIEDYTYQAIGIGNGGIEITETEYNEIMEILQHIPSAEGKGYRLKTDLTWEAYDLPPEPEPSDEDEISDTEALNVIMGVTA